MYTGGYYRASINPRFNAVYHDPKEVTLCSVCLAVHYMCISSMPSSVWGKAIDTVASLLCKGRDKMMNVAHTCFKDG